MEIHIQIKLQGAHFPSTEEFLLRDEIEESLGNQPDMTIIDVGSGLGVMDIVLEVNNTESATKTIQQLLEKYQIEQATTVNIEKPKKAQRQVKAGDVFCALLGEDAMAVGLVLHVSKVFKNSIMVGFYDQEFQSLEEIDIRRLGGPFVDTPNYTGKQLLTSGPWKLIGHSQELLAASTIPELRVVNHIYYKDEVVRHFPATESREAYKYPALVGQGRIYIENKLREHYAKKRSEPNS